MPSLDKYYQEQTRDKPGTQYYDTSEYSQYVVLAHKNAAYEKPCGKDNK
jgi:hypothetical protein